MKKRLLLLFLPFLFACSKDETTVQVIRNPLVKFSGTAINWTADSYSFSQPLQVVAYPSVGSTSGKIYTRYRMQATGRDNKGQRLQLILMFDSADPTHLKGEYRPGYTVSRGLAGIELYNLEENNLAVYSVLASDSATARLQIDRQSESQHLLAGSFQGTLSNKQDTTKKITITDGVLNDVRYNP